MKFIRQAFPSLLVLSLALSPVGVAAQVPPDPAVPPSLVVPDAPASPESPVAPVAPAKPAGEPDSEGRRNRSSSSKNHQEIVQIGHSVHVAAGETVRSVVVIQSSATIDGDVDEDLVVIGGKARINGKVNGDVVNVGGGIVLGPDAHIRGNAVGVLGGIRMGINSIIGGDACGIIGGIEMAAGAQIHGEKIDQHIDLPFGKWTGPDGFQLPRWLEVTLREIVLKFRPLSFRVNWVWVVAGIFLALHLLLTLIAPGMVRTISSTLSDRGATSFLMGFLALPLGALITLILIATGVGLVVVPFFGAAFLFVAFAGKAGLLHFLGASVARRADRDLAPVAAVAVGTVLLAAIYLIPFIGMVSWAVFSMWATGAGLLALLNRFQREARPEIGRPSSSPVPVRPEPRSVYPHPSGSSHSMMAISPSTDATTPASPAEPTTTTESTEPDPAPLGAGTGTGTPVNATADAAPGPGPQSSSSPPTGHAQPPFPPDALLLPRIALKERLLASVLDGFLLMLLFAVIDVHGIRWNILLAIGYFTGFWFWRQTTLGGIVLRLKVVRLDGRPMDVATAFVRSLSAVFGVLALGLGYFWAAWDPEAQGWHDKIAGTVVVRTPRSQPLV